MSSQASNYASENSIYYYGWTITAMASFANMIGFGIVYAYGVFIVALASDLGWSRSTLSGAFSFYAIFHTVLAFFAGRFVDKYGPRIILAIGGACIGLSMVLMCFANSMLELYIFYGGIFSVGIAAVYTPAVTTVSHWFNEKRGLALGLNAAGLGAGSMIFSPLSGWLISSFGWRKSYMILGIIAWIAYIPIVKFIKQMPMESEEKESKTKRETAIPIKGLSLSEALKTGTFWGFCMAWMLICIALWSIIVHIVPLASDRGLSLVTAGSLAGLIGALSIIGRISGGFLSDRFGRKNVVITAFLLQLLPTIWLFYSTQTWMLFIFAIFFGISTGSWAGVLPAFPADYFGNRATGAILGFVIVFAGIGVGIGPYLSGVMFDKYGSYNMMILLCISANIAALVSSFFIRPVMGVNK